MREIKSRKKEGEKEIMSDREKEITYSPQSKKSVLFTALTLYNSYAGQPSLLLLLFISFINWTPP